jgi:hypothetical protein
MTDLKAQLGLPSVGHRWGLTPAEVRTQRLFSEPAHGGDSASILLTYDLERLTIQ